MFSYQGRVFKNPLLFLKTLFFHIRVLLGLLGEFEGYRGSLDLGPPSFPGLRAYRVSGAGFRV